jgi:hypothetical protein
VETAVPADDYYRETVDAKPVILSIVATETVIWDAVAVVTAPLLPAAMFRLPAVSAIPLPSDLLHSCLLGAPLLCRPVVLLLTLLTTLHDRLLLTLLALLILLPSGLLLFRRIVLLLTLLALLILLPSGLLLLLLVLLLRGLSLLLLFRLGLLLLFCRFSFLILFLLPGVSRSGDSKKQ